ncbi:MAG: hypothetical protein J7L23_04075 [Candidatus Diapherotrites archaeon]|nr:hypothetical protein [Candidatus Diapherotrites archaeon]
MKEDSIMVVLIGYDTTGTAPHMSCMPIGRPDDISKLRESIEKVLRSNGFMGDIHWSEVPFKVKQKSKTKLMQEVKEGRVVFFIFKHKRPLGYKRKDYYFRQLPNKIAAILETHLANVSKQTEGLQIEIDDDWDKIRGGNSKMFLETLLRDLCHRLRGVEVSPKKAGKGFNVILSWAGGKSKRITGEVGNRQKSSILLADVMLGMYRTKGYEDLEKIIEIDVN